jgi:Domain of unknown function (DUF4263)
MTKLLSGKYRGNVYPPSRELGGSIVQVNDYCDVLRELLRTRQPGVELSAFNPRRVVIIGNYEKELTDSKKKRSFELFRTGLFGVDIITFDEFFKKIEHHGTPGAFFVPRQCSGPPLPPNRAQAISFRGAEFCYHFATQLGGTR